MTHVQAMSTNRMPQGNTVYCNKGVYIVCDVLSVSLVHNTTQGANTIAMAPQENTDTLAVMQTGVF